MKLLSMKRLSLILSTFSLLLTVTLVSYARPKPGVVSGKVTTVGGRPLPNADILVTGFYGAGKRFEKTIKSGANGNYSIAVPRNGFYTVTGSIKVPFNGQNFKLELHPKNGKHDSRRGAAGIEKDFLLKLTGRRIYGGDANNAFSYYGGSVRLSYFQSSNAVQLPDTTPVTFTLTPEGKLADGSPGKTLTMTRTIKALKGSGFNQPLTQTNVLHDIPLGKYRLTAVAAVPGGEKKSMALGNVGQASESADINFTPNTLGSGGISGVIISMTNPS